LAPDPLEPRAQGRQQLVLRKPGLLRGARQVVIELDPVAFLELLRRIAVDREQVPRYPTEPRQRKFAGEDRAARREAAQIAVGIADVEDRGLGVRPCSEGC